MASFQAKIDWKRRRKRENKNYRSVSFQHNPQQKIPKKIAKKLKKIKKYHCGFILSRNRLGTDEKERTQKLSFRSFPPDPQQKIPKKQQKNSKT